MTAANDALPLEGGAATRPASPHGKRCGRNVDAGPGTCFAWWDGCPAKVFDCYMRELRSIADAHHVNYRDAMPEKMLDDVHAMHARRRKGLLP